MSSAAGSHAPGPPVRPVVWLVALAMLALPLTQLVVRWAQQGSRAVTELPASWQMYSAVLPPRYVGTDASGRVRRLDVGPLPPVVRAVDVGSTVPDRLCATQPDLVSVRREGGTQPGTFGC